MNKNVQAQIILNLKKTRSWWRGLAVGFLEPIIA